MPFAKGYTPWNVGKGSAPQIGVALKGQKHPSVSKKNSELIGINSRHWNDNKVGYFGLHDWIRKNLGNSTNCKHCGSADKKRYEWANISGEYKRELNDWIRLCKSCHNKYDVSLGRWGDATKLIKAQRLDRKAG